MYSKDDDVEQDADAVDDQRQEDCVLAIKEKSIIIYIITNPSKVL